MDDNGQKAREEHWRPGMAKFGSGSWVPGVILILLGLVFLFNNLTGYQLENWWALFILIPAFSNFSTAYDRYRHSGGLDRFARARLFWGLFFVLLSAVFLLNFDLGNFWPVFLILGGLGLLLGAF